MNAAHMHLVLNHIPVFTTLFALVLLAFSRLGSRVTVMRIGLYSLIAGAIFAVGAYITGEPAEAVIEHLPGVATSAIDAHEDIALISLVSAILLGIAAATVAYVVHARGTLMRSFAVALLLFTTVSASLFSVTAYLGGQIHHTEISSASGGALPASAVPGGAED